MKAIIEGRLYDTAAAKKILRFRRKVDKGPVFWDERLHWTPMHDFILYRTEKGAFFEHDTGDNVIQTLNEEVAKDIVRRLDVDKYMELFGKVEEA